MALIAPGGGGTINVTPADVQAAARQFGSSQNDLYNAWSTLQSTLDANGGMAGHDQPAGSFTSYYNPAVSAAWNALRVSLVSLGAISTGLTQTANNFTAAENHSNATGHGSQPVYGDYPVIYDIEMADPPSPTGPGETVWFLPGPLAKFWPNANTDRVSACGAAWHHAASAITSLSGDAVGSLNRLESDDDTSKAISSFAARIYTPGDDRTVLAATAQICQALGSACDQYVTAVNAKRSQVRDALIGAGIAVGVTTIIGVGLSLFTGGASDAGAGIADEVEVEAAVGDVAADLAGTVGGDMSATIGDGLVSAVEAAADDAPAVDAVGAETTQVQSDLEGALDKSMAEDLGDSGLERLSDSEAATLERLRAEFPDRDLQPAAEERDGEYVDSQGRTYDQMGNPKTSDYWNPQSAQRFYQSILSHLNKSIDYTVIDLTGFSPESIEDITNFVDNLSPAQQAKIIRIGF